MRKKLKKGDLRNFIILIIIFLLTNAFFYFIFDILKKLLDDKVLKPFIGISIIEKFPILYSVVISIMAIVFSGIFTYVKYYYLYAPKSKTIPILLVKTKENNGDYAEYLEYIPEIKTSLMPSFERTGFIKKFLAIIYILFTTIWFFDNNYYVASFFLTIPFIVYTAKGIVSKDKRKVDIKIKIGTLLVFLGVFIFVTTNILQNIKNQNMKSRLLSDSLYFLEDNTKTLDKEKVLNYAILFDRDNPKPYLKMANYFDSTMQKQKAMEYYLKINIMMPWEAEPYYKLGMNYLEKKLEKVALDYFVKARVLNPDFGEACFEEARIYYSRGELDCAEKILNSLNYKEKEYSYNVYFLKGKILRDRKKYNEAMEAIFMASQKDNSKPEAFFERAMLFEKIGSVEGALQNIEKAIKLNSKEKTYFYYKGQLLLKQKDGAGALIAFNDALKLDKKYFLAKASIGLALLEMGKREQALNDIDSVVGAECTVAEGCYFKAQVFREVKSYEYALYMINRAISINDKVSEYYAYKALIQMEMGNSIEVAELVEKALEIDNKDYLAYYAKGVFLMDSKDFKGATAIFSNSIKENFYFARAYSLKAYCEHKMGNYSISNDYIYVAFYLDPYDYYNRLIYANILDDSGLETIATDEKNKAARLYDLSDN